MSDDLEDEVFGDEGQTLGSNRKKRKKSLVSILIVAVMLIAAFGSLTFVVVKMQSKSANPETGENGNSTDSGDNSQNGDGQKPATAPKVKVYKVSKGTFINKMETRGSIQAKSSVDLKFEVNGIMTVVNVVENDQVYTGTIVAELNHEDAELKVQFRKSKLKEAEIQKKNLAVKHEQNKALFEAGAITELKLQESKFAVESAEQAVKSAKIELQSSNQELDKTYLKCPIDGVVGAIEKHKGEYVTSQGKILSIMEVSTVFCEFSVLEKNIQDVKPDLKINLTVDAYPGEVFEGVIESLGSVIETSQGHFRKVKAVVENNDMKLLPGMFASVSVVLYYEEDVIMIPNTAFLDISKDTSFVWVIDENSKSVKREVDVEQFNNDMALVGEGLKVDEMVVVDVATVKLKDNSEVEVVEVKEAQQ